MIFDKYIAIIVEKIERHAAIIINEIKDENKILQSEIGALHAKFDDRNELFEKIVQLGEKNLELERENRTLEEATEGVQEEFVEVSEKWESLSESFRELEESNQKMCEETFEREDRANKKLKEQFTTIAQLEHEVQSAKAVVNGLMGRNVEAVAKAERLLALAKEYDKATVTLLNAVLERKPAVKEREVWEKAKEDLKGWDKPKRKAGRPKKQS